MGFIYKIKNTANNKIYIGQTLQANCKRRWSKHKCDLNYNRHGNIHLQNAWNKHGQEKFKFSIVVEGIDNRADLNQWEIIFIKLYKTLDKNYGYNKILNECCVYVCQSTKDKISKANKGKLKGERNPNYKKLGKNNHNFGREMSKEERLARSKSAKKYWNTNHSRDVSGKNNPFYGKTHSKQVKEKISRLKKGKGIDNTLYYFIHKNGTEEVCSAYHLVEKYNLSSPNINMIKNGSRASHKGWRCTCLINYR